MFATYNQFTDLNGKTIERTKLTHPYSYDEFATWIGDFDVTVDIADYSDRLYQWDYEKYDKICLELWNNKSHYFYNRNPSDIQRFLCLYMDKEIKLTAIVEGCNVSNGSPYWVFYYKEVK